MPNKTATLKYSYPLARKVSSYYTLRQFGRSTVICVFLLTLAASLAFAYGFDLQFFGIIGLSVAGAVGLYFWYRHVVLRRWTEALTNMGKPEAELIVDEQSFTITSGAGSATIPWRRCTNLWKRTEFWLLFLGKDYMPMTLPLDGVDPEILRMIEMKVSEAHKMATNQSNPFNS